MSSLGIIAEYNPFHQGHLFHLNQSIKRTNTSATICIMSGDFLQRGEPALVNKWSRTKMALQQGIDLVIQLPIPYSIRNAEKFAFGSIQLLAKTGIVDYLSFGSEWGKIEELKIINDLLEDEPDKLSQLIKDNLSKGSSYPQAQSQAIINYLKNNPGQSLITAQDAKEIITNPNNILGLEYLKRLNKSNSNITPITIKRRGANYHSSKLEKLASATAIRTKIKSNYYKNKNLLNNELTTLLLQGTEEVLKEDFNQGLGPIFYKEFASVIITLLRRSTLKEIKNYEDIRGGLEYKIKTAAHKATSIEELITNIKSKRFTRTRIQRTLIQILLGLNQEILSAFDQHEGPQYLRVLGFTKRGQKLLKKMKKRATLPIITKIAQYYKTGQTPKNLLQKMLHYDLLASDLYSLAYPNQSSRQGGRDFYQSPIIQH